MELTFSFCHFSAKAVIFAPYLVPPLYLATLNSLEVTHKIVWQEQVQWIPL